MNGALDLLGLNILNTAADAIVLGQYATAGSGILTQIRSRPVVIKTLI